jgi:hypothetical protein
MIENWLITEGMRVGIGQSLLEPVTYGKEMKQALFSCAGGNRGLTLTNSDLKQGGQGTVLNTHPRAASVSWPQLAPKRPLGLGILRINHLEHNCSNNAGSDVCNKIDPEVCPRE